MTWVVLGPNDYAPDNPYATDWIVRSDLHKGQSAILATEREALAVRDVLNQLATESR